MNGFIAIIAFPLLTAVGFAGVYSVSFAVNAGKPSGTVERYSPLFYVLFLAVPVALILPSVAAQGGLAGLGLALPALPTLSALPTTALVIVGGVASGWLLYKGEILLSLVLARAMAPRKSTLYRLVQGQSEELIVNAALLPIPLLLLVTALIVGAEELLWRGYLIPFLVQQFALDPSVALLVSSVAFALNHYYFGVRNILTKLVPGLVWGAGLLLTGSLLFGLVSHLVYNVLALNLTIEWGEPKE